ncbi:hypothetical protein CEP52_013391 [Fusarium oligoseptatum]|uniref:Uncharacterized protein n=1 Tax=Fusarium oligoseptatum TaxID=2604345 RepID=A0A428STX0_9HYPO|nr:hypothetical protein CEP52_013391 [Fusarium oligoseptatum]
MNGTESPESQKPPPSTNGHASTNSSLAAKKRKKDGLKPIITMEGANPHPAIGAGKAQHRRQYEDETGATASLTFSVRAQWPLAKRHSSGLSEDGQRRHMARYCITLQKTAAGSEAG